MIGKRSAAFALYRSAGLRYNWVVGFANAARRLTGGREMKRIALCALMLALLLHGGCALAQEAQDYGGGGGEHRRSLYPVLQDGHGL